MLIGDLHDFPFGFQYFSTFASIDVLMHFSSFLFITFFKFSFEFFSIPIPSMNFVNTYYFISLELTIQLFPDSTLPLPLTGLSHAPVVTVWYCPYLNRHYSHSSAFLVVFNIISQRDSPQETRAAT